jgi:putative transferase (TIGR04331 family)
MVIGTSGHQGFEKYIRMQMPEMLPACYVEGYRQLVDLTQTLSWPAEPRFIFTSNNFDQDEVFKVWTAAKVEEDIPYYVGAHGNYNVSPYVEADTTSPECVTADRFFTWGWKDKNPKFVPAFLFKVAGRKLVQMEPNPDSLLLIEVFLSHRRTHWDSYFEFGIYQEEQFRFVEALPRAIQDQLTVRLHGDHKNHEWCDEQRWKERCPQVQIETGVASIRGLIAKSRLLVYSYDSTGILEALASNVPMMCFWYGGLNHLLPSARPYYESLNRVGILSYSPEQAAENVALRWDRVHDWWESSEVQEARLRFCENYARNESAPVRTMKRLLSAHANQSSRDNLPSVPSPNASWQNPV